jgi:hypothetical protein
MCHDYEASLWLVYRPDGRTYVARPAWRIDNETSWVGEPFAISPDNFMYVGATRDRRRGAVRIDECGTDELRGLFRGVRVPFTLGWSMPDE